MKTVTKSKSRSTAIAVTMANQQKAAKLTKYVVDRLGYDRKQASSVQKSLERIISGKPASRAF